MSMTIFIHARLESVSIVRWFLDPRFPISYACGPVTEMSLTKFRATGYDWVRDHFSEFSTRRASESDVVQPFNKLEAKKFMAERDVVEIRRQPSGELRFSPAVVRRFDLGSGVETLEAEKRRTISEDCSPELFWQTFEQVLSFSRERSQSRSRR
jgi:hypothetical protein